MFAVAAILAFRQLEEASVLDANSKLEAGETAPSAGYNPPSEILIDDSIACIDALKVVETLLTRWIGHLDGHKNIFAEKLLHNFMQCVLWNGVPGSLILAGGVSDRARCSDRHCSGATSGAR